MMVTQRSHRQSSMWLGKTSHRSVYTKQGRSAGAERAATRELSSQGNSLRLQRPLMAA
jgi:hypothetical protein